VKGRFIAATAVAVVLLILFVLLSPFLRYAWVTKQLSKDPVAEKFHSYFPGTKIHISYFANRAYPEKTAYMEKVYQQRLEFDLFFDMTLENNGYAPATQKARR